MYLTIEKWVCSFYSKLNSDTLREAIANITRPSEERKLKMRYLKGLSLRYLLLLLF